MKSHQTSTETSDHRNHSYRELMSRSDLRALGIRASNPTLLIWEEESRFPKRLALSPAKVAWLRHEVIAWIEAKAAARG
jgi:predicted DNA-binding transcriptional regulator AlpA